MNNLAIINITEECPPEEDSPLTTEILIETDIKDKAELTEIAKKIKQIKENADSDYEFGETGDDESEDFGEYTDTLGFAVPDEWNSYSWDEKITIAAEHLATVDNRIKILSRENAPLRISIEIN